MSEADPKEVCIFWFRRDLRLEDNAGLTYALEYRKNVLPVFVFDTDILEQLEDKRDRRVEFIHTALVSIQQQLMQMGSSLLVLHGKPVEAFINLCNSFNIKAVYTNHDYEPYAIKRDEKVKRTLEERGISFYTFRDQVIFEKSDILKPDKKPYTVFTPYMRKWRERLTSPPHSFETSRHHKNFLKIGPFPIPSLKEIGFITTGSEPPPPNLSTNLLMHYEQRRNIPSLAATSRLGVHLRFGTISVRKVVREALAESEAFLNELIWREFFMMILWHFPHITTRCFKPAYENIRWRNNENEFDKWCRGETGYPLVDAGMRELEQTGFMPNRVRMVVASFLCKHLLIDWRWGEAWFASKLLDYEMASNIGNWQWVAGCGCDAAPYFRIFNPSGQAGKFDPDNAYIRKWVPEFNTSQYPDPIVDHAFARDRALKAYKQGLGKELT